MKFIEQTFKKCNNGDYKEYQLSIVLKNLKKSHL